MRWVPNNGGGVPLGYLTQRPFVLAGGPFAFWARLPSALFSAASCWVVFALCRALRLPRSTAIFAVGVFMIVPAQFRYATEARPYSEAMCFMLLAMLAIVKWMHLPRLRMISLGLLAMVAGLYTQPYTALALFGLCAWYALSGLQQRNGWRTAVPLAYLCLSGLLFLPWFMLAARQWDASIQSSGYPKFHWTFALAQDAFKGISGGSFFCSLSLLLLVALGIRSSAPEIRGLLLSGAVVTIVGALAADSSLNYFFAARQFLFAVPNLSIIAAVGLTSALRGNRVLGMVAAGIFLVAAVTNDVTMQLNARENWSAAANLLARVTRDGYCVEMASTGQGPITLYSVFVPSLSSALCDNLPVQSRVALVSNLATGTKDLNASEDRLRNMRFALQHTTEVGGTTIQLEVR